MKRKVEKLQIKPIKQSWLLKNINKIKKIPRVSKKQKIQNKKLGIIARILPPTLQK